MTRTQPVDERQSFTVELGHLVRTVAKADGSTYSHRCSIASYKAIAHFIEENAGQGVTTGSLWEAVPDVPCTQASVAVAYMKERGCLTVRQRRMFPTSRFFFEDAMIEYYALEHVTGDTLAREAEAAQRASNWRRAAAIWREAAEATEDAKQAEWFAKQAAWCDDMAVLVNETDGQP
jgi:hypothetical protein